MPDRADPGGTEILTFGPTDPAAAAFLALPRALYHGDPHYRPPAPAALIAHLQRVAAPERLRLFLLRVGGVAVARAAAVLSPALQDDAGQPLGLIGWFEAEDRPDTVRALLSGAVAWLRGQGAGRIVGPLDGDTWHRYRVNAGPFERPPFLLEPYNPPYYHSLWLDAGFRILESYYSAAVEDVADAASRLAAAVPRLRQQGYSLRPLQPARLQSELRAIYHIALNAFRGSFLYTAIPEAEFMDLYADSRDSLVPDLVWFAENGSGEPVGFVFAFPDLLPPVAAGRGPRGSPAPLRCLPNGGRVDTVNLKTLAVLRECRGLGLGKALMATVYRKTLELGHRRAQLCLIRAGQPSGATAAGLGTEMRRYHLYEWQNGSRGQTA